MIGRINAACGAIMLCAPVMAQQPVIASAPQVIVAQKAAVGNSLPSNTEVWLSLNDGLSTKQTKVGDKFDVTVSRDVMMGDYVVIPRGTQGHGQIAYRTGKGAFGKSAKMEFDLVDVKLGDRYIPVSGHYRIEGNGNTGAAVGAVVAVGVFGAFVTGHSATAAQGSEWKAYTKEPLMVAFAQPQQTPVVATAPSAPAASPNIQPAVAAVPAINPNTVPANPGGATLQKTSATTTS